MMDRLVGMGRRVLRRFRRADRIAKPTVTRSFGSWDVLTLAQRRVVQVCHPEWRGVRGAAYAFRAPVIEAADLGIDTPGLVAELAAHDVATVVLHAWPPGAAPFLETAAAAGLTCRVLIHSSPAQHGTDRGEAEAVTEAFDLARRGVITGVGFVKEGVAEAYRAMGHRADYVPNRAPVLPEYDSLDLGPGRHVGIFGYPYWRKNVSTQIAAAALLGATVHVLAKPDIGYLDGVSIVEHGELSWRQFLPLAGSVDLNLNVTLSEGYPMTPMESYLAGVPCLLSTTSALFKSQPDLYRLTTVAEADNPRAVAEAAEQLLARRQDAVAWARSWIEAHDLQAAAVWDRFVA